MMALIAEGRDQLEGERLEEAVATYDEPPPSAAHIRPAPLAVPTGGEAAAAAAPAAVARARRGQVAATAARAGRSGLRAGERAPGVRVRTFVAPQKAVSANPGSAELWMEVIVQATQNIVSRASLASPSPQAVSANPNDAELWMEAVSANPNDAELWMEVGAEREVLGQHERAFEAFSRALELLPGNAEALKRRGLSAVNCYRFKDSLKDLLPPFPPSPPPPPPQLPPSPSHPNFPLPPRIAGLSAFNCYRFRDALKDLLPALHMLPNDADLNRAVGIALVRSNQFRPAQPYLARAVELLPGDADVRKEKGRLHRLLGETHQAETDLLHSLELGQILETHHNLVLQKRLLGDHWGVIRMADAGLKAFPGELEIMHAKASSLHMLGEHAAAVNAPVRQAARLARPAQRADNLPPEDLLPAPPAGLHGLLPLAQFKHQRGSLPGPIPPHQMRLYDELLSSPVQPGEQTTYRERTFFQRHLLAYTISRLDQPFSAFRVDDDLDEEWRVRDIGREGESWGGGGKGSVYRCSSSLPTSLQHPTDFIATPHRLHCNTPPTSLQYPTDFIATPHRLHCNTPPTSLQHPTDFIATPHRLHCNTPPTSLQHPTDFIATPHRLHCNTPPTSLQHPTDFIATPHRLHCNTPPTSLQHPTDFIATPHRLHCNTPPTSLQHPTDFIATPHRLHCNTPPTSLQHPTDFIATPHRLHCNTPPTSLQYPTDFIATPHRLHCNTPPTSLQHPTDFIAIPHRLHCNTPPTSLQYPTDFIATPHRLHCNTPPTSLQHPTDFIATPHRLHCNTPPTSLQHPTDFIATPHRLHCNTPPTSLQHPTDFIATPHRLHCNTPPTSLQHPTDFIATPHRLHCNTPPTSLQHPTDFIATPHRLHCNYPTDFIAIPHRLHCNTPPTSLQHPTDFIATPHRLHCNTPPTSLQHPTDFIATPHRLHCNTPPTSLQHPTDFIATPHRLHCNTPPTSLQYPTDFIATPHRLHCNTPPTSLQHPTDFIATPHRLHCNTPPTSLQHPTDFIATPHRLHCNTPPTSLQHPTDFIATPHRLHCNTPPTSLQHPTDFIAIPQSPYSSPLLPFPSPPPPLPIPLSPHPFATSPSPLFSPHGRQGKWATGGRPEDLPGFVPLAIPEDQLQAATWQRLPRLSGAAVELVEAADLIGARTHYDTDGMLHNTQQLRMAGLASLDVMQQVRRTLLLIADQMRIAPLLFGTHGTDGADEQWQEQLEQVLQERQGGQRTGRSRQSSSSSGSSGGGGSRVGRNILDRSDLVTSWRHVFRVLVAWRQVSEAQESIAWKAFGKGQRWPADMLYRTDTPIFTWVMGTARYLAVYPKAVNVTRQGLLQSERAFDTNTHQPFDVPRSTFGPQLEAAEDHEGIFNVIGRDFYVRLPCYSRAFPGRSHARATFLLPPSHPLCTSAASESHCLPFLPPAHPPVQEGSGRHRVSIAETTLSPQSTWGSGLGGFLTLLSHSHHTTIPHHLPPPPPLPIPARWQWEFDTVTPIDPGRPLAVDFDTVTPIDATRWNAFDSELTAAWQGFMEAALDHHTKATSPHTYRQRIQDQIIAIAYYWFQLMPLSRGSAMVGLMSILGLSMGADMQTTTHVPRDILRAPFHLPSVRDTLPTTRHVIAALSDVSGIPVRDTSDA
ncbi:unnamed protein product [Closterium sp. NIES-64]|nr:unnamed protein product [Closterium sp. NIES-64]